MASPFLAKGAAMDKWLDFIAKMQWSVIAVFLLAFYHGEIAKKIGDISEISPEGAKFKNADSRIEEFGNNLSSSLGDVQSVLTQASDPKLGDQQRLRLVEYAGVSLNAAQSTSTRSIGQVRKDLVGTRPPELRESAKDLERDGFEGILASSYERALSGFEAAHKVYPQLHNAKEILAALKAKQHPLQADDRGAWAALQSDVLRKWSWGMSPDLRKRFKAQVEHPKN